MPLAYQSGGSLRDIGNIYRQPYRVQFGRGYYARGQGLGDVFRGVLSFLRPIFSQGSKALGSELLKGGAEVLENLGGEKSVSELLKEQKTKRLKNLQSMAIDKLTRMQSGSGLRTIKSKNALMGAFINKVISKPKPGKAKRGRKKKIGVRRKKKAKKTVVRKKGKKGRKRRGKPKKDLFAE